MPEFESDFYKAENIIGYTGDVNKNPTVYFQDGNAFGHIIQDHNDPFKIGREAVIDSPNCKLENTGPGGVLQESIEGREHHTSRYPLVRTSNKDDLTKLEQAINRFPELKKVSIENVERCRKRAKKFGYHTSTYFNAMINYKKKKVMGNVPEFESNFQKIENEMKNTPKYESDFYKAENIIGYTGDINGKPSVYFQDGDKIGHITQDHLAEERIGREPVIAGPGCRLTNNGPGGGLQESIYGKVHYMYRDPLVKTSNKEDIAKLEKAIHSFPGLTKIAAERAEFVKEQAQKGIPSKIPYFNALINYEKQKLMQ